MILLYHIFRVLSIYFCGVLWEATQYASGLVNLIYKQTTAQAEVTIKKLAELAADSRYSNNQKIVKEYARGLVNLSAVQTAEQAEVTINKPQNKQK